jgi:mannosyltransferase PIG-V
MLDSASEEAQRSGRSVESILAPIRARLGALGSDERVRRWRWVAFPLTLWAVTRVAIVGFGSLSMTFVPGLVQSAGLHREYLLRHTSIEGLCRWDCRFFQDLANHGYVHEGYTNFFPLYPLLARALHEVTGLHIDLCLILVPNLAALGGLLVLYRLVTFLEDELAAKWTLMLFISFPFAFFQAMAYPESLMVLFTALAVYLALRGSHIWAGVALGVGVLARHLSLFAGGSLVVAQVKQRPSVRRFLLSPALLGLVIPWLFLGAYCAYQYVRFGDALAFVKVRDNWGPVAWWGVADWWRNGPPRNVVMGSYVVFALPAVAAAVASLFRRKWWELAGFSVPMLLVLFYSGIWGMGRYTASCWAAFVPLGVWLSRRPLLQTPVVASFALLQGMMFFLVQHQFSIL